MTDAAAVAALGPAQQAQLEDYLVDDGLNKHHFGPNGGWTALQRECARSNVVMVEALLLCEGVEVDSISLSPDDGGRTALELLALEAGQLEDPERLGRVSEMMRLLRDAGAKRPRAVQELLDAFEKTGNQVLLSMAQDLCQRLPDQDAATNLEPSLHARLATMTIPASGLEDHDWAWRTLFLLAAEAGATDKLENLVNAGANVRARDMYGNTALHVAAAGDRLDAVRKLLHVEQTKPLITAVTARGETALDLAIRGKEVAGDRSDKFQAICDLLEATAAD